MSATTKGRGNSNARGRATVRAIEAAAVRLASAHGASAITVDQICAEAGIKQRTFFNHFDTKEDAILGWELPRIDEQRVREYLADAKVGVLTGAMGLVALPEGDASGEDLSRARFAVLASSPSLAERQAARMRPLVGEVQEIVRLKLRELDDGEGRDLEAAAALITQVAAVLMVGRGARPDADPADAPRSLEWVWGRLL